MSKIILAIDIGSTETYAVIGNVQNGDLNISGHGIARTQGIKKGTITNIELASQSIKKAVDDAKRISGIDMKTATISISNTYTKNVNSAAIANIPNHNISIPEINRVMQIALYNANIPNDFEVLHVLPFRFKVDNQDYIEDPYGMTGSRIEVDTHIVMVSKANLENLKRSFNAVGITVDRVVLGSYASTISVMDENDRERGVAIMDLGGQTSSLLVYSGNSIRYNYSIGIGSYNISNDLSIALQTPLNIAEYLKRSKANLLEKYDSDKSIDLPIIGDEKNFNSVSIELIQNIIYSRTEETISILLESFMKSHLKNKIGLGIILTGGMTHIKGIRELAQKLTQNIPVRIGSLQKNIKSYDFLKSPNYITVIGLLCYEAGEHTEYEIESNKVLFHSKKDRESYNSNNLEKPKISVSKPNFNNNEDNLFDIEDIKKNEDKSSQGFWSWASKIF